MRNKYFKFYVADYDLFDKVSIFQIKKLLKALCAYQEYGCLTVKLNKKSYEVFNQIVKIQEKEKIFYSAMGKKGLSRRYNEKRNYR